MDICTNVLTHKYYGTDIPLNTSGNKFQWQIISADNRLFPYQFYLPRSMRRVCCQWLLGFWAFGPSCFIHVWPMPKLGFPSSWCIILNAFHLVKEWQNWGSRTCCGKKTRQKGSVEGTENPTVSLECLEKKHWKTRFATWKWGKCGVAPKTAATSFL